MKIIRSTAAVAALCAITWFTTASAQAQTFPDRTISLVVPFAPGGAADTTGRIMADAMSRRLGKAVIVENVGGAGGSIGTARVKHSRPDGYTIGIGHRGRWPLRRRSHRIFNSILEQISIISDL